MKKQIQRFCNSPACAGSARAGDFVAFQYMRAIEHIKRDDERWSAVAHAKTRVNCEGTFSSLDNYAVY